MNYWQPEFVIFAVVLIAVFLRVVFIGCNHCFPFYDVQHNLFYLFFFPVSLYKFSVSLQ